MGVRNDGNGHSSNWKLLIGLSVLCGVVVFLGGFLHRRALDSAIADRQAKSVAFVDTQVAAAAKDDDLSRPMKDSQAASFTKRLDLPAGTDLRLFSTAGVPLYASPGLAPFPADAEAIHSAASGDEGRVIDGSGAHHHGRQAQGRQYEETEPNQAAHAASPSDCDCCGTRLVAASIA